MTSFPHKPADVGARVIAPIRNRWSPVRFDSARPIPHGDLRVLFDAARWAPSSFNEQPWRYLCARKGDPHRPALEEALFDGNAYARRASVLLCALVKATRTRDGRPNPAGLHDLGMANMNLITQATAMGMICHPMGGFDRDVIRAAFDVPEDYRPVVMLAVGWHDASLSDPALVKREERPRSRKPLDETVFGGSFGVPLDLDGQG